jgi:hypothetical protein
MAIITDTGRAIEIILAAILIGMVSAPCRVEIGAIPIVVRVAPMELSADM